MIEIQGKYTKIKVMSDVVEESAYKQLLDVTNQEIFKYSKIVIMSDIHAGAGCVIGFTMPITTFVVPNLVGVDIGCGIDGYCLGELENINFKEFDDYVRKNVPNGFETHNKCNLSKSSELYSQIEDVVLRLQKEKLVPINPERVFNSLGSLGAGNHYIEIGISDKTKNAWLTIHSGSRNFGLQVANHYQKKAKQFIDDNKIDGVQKGLEYLLLETKEGQDYLKDMRVAQEYALMNRRIMSQILLDYFKLWSVPKIETTHNYIHPKDNILRKGAVQAVEGQELIIPFNMRDGMIIGRGKGNPDWNYSAPHGAGRVLGRGAAKKTLDLTQFENEMKGVWSSCISKETLDESPMAYKPKEEILKHVGDTIDILEFVEPLYNFKSSGE